MKRLLLIGLTLSCLFGCASINTPGIQTDAMASIQQSNSEALVSSKDSETSLSQAIVQAESLKDALTSAKADSKTLVKTDTLITTIKTADASVKATRAKLEEQTKQIATAQKQVSQVLTEKQTIEKQSIKKDVKLANKNTTIFILVFILFLIAAAGAYWLYKRGLFSLALAALKKLIRL